MNFAPFLLLLASRSVAQTKLPPILPKPVSMRAGSGGGFEVRPGTVVINRGGTPAVKLLETLFTRGAGFRTCLLHHEAALMVPIEFIQN